ncbi:MAG: hypothetical protein Q9179_002943 [Wetmoreana sp. 5 TL-2023]
MAEGLPEGLVTTNQDVKGNIESVDRLDVEDITRLWKGRRLENFFWRIWCSDRLLQNMSGILVAAIFSKISEGGYIRTTPTQSPRSSRSLGTFHRPQQPEGQHTPPPSGKQKSAPSSQGSPGHDNADDAEETETESSSSSRKKLPPRPPPILKKTKPAPPQGIPQRTDVAVPHGQRSFTKNAVESSSVSESFPSTAANLHSSRHEGESHRKSLERSDKVTRFSPSRSQTVIGEGDVSDAPTNLHAKGKQKAGRRKVAMIASTSASRRRPVVRQRSSQSSSNSAPITSSSQAESEAIGGDRGQDRDAAVDVTRTAKSSIASMLRQQSPRHDGRVEVQEETIEKRVPQQPASNDKPGAPRLEYKPGSPAIPSQTSLTSLPSILKKPSAIAATSASYQASGTMNLGQPSAYSKDHSAESNIAPTLGSHLQPRSKEMGSIQDLPRSQSQLSLLLQKDRKSSHRQ